MGPTLAKIIWVICGLAHNWQNMGFIWGPSGKTVYGENMGYPIWEFCGLHMGPRWVKRIWAEYGLSHLGIKWVSYGTQMGKQNVGKIWAIPFGNSMGFIWDPYGSTEYGENMGYPIWEFHGFHMGPRWVKRIWVTYGLYPIWE